MAERYTPVARPLAERVLVYSGIVVLIILGMSYLDTAITALLVVFSAVLFAVFVSGIAAFIEARTPVSYPLALAATGVLLLGVTILFGWLLGPRLVTQLDTLKMRLPDTVGELRAFLEQSGFGRTLLELTPSMDQVSGGGGSSLIEQAFSLFSTTIGTLTNTLVIVVVGVFIAASPQTYKAGLLRLLPRARRRRAHEVVDTLGHALGHWIIGRLASMLVVGVLTAIGLWAIGLPLALTMGVLAGVLSFVPFLGPTVSAVPALLIGLNEGPRMLLYVLLVYGGVQFLEGNFITPLIQKRAVSIPPALLLSAQLFFGTLVGIFGVIVSTPVAVTLIVLVQMLYIQDVLGEDVTVLGT